MTEKDLSTNIKFQEFMCSFKELETAGDLNNWKFPIFDNKTKELTEYGSKLFKKHIAGVTPEQAKEKVRIGHFEYFDLTRAPTFI